MTDQVNKQVRYTSLFNRVCQEERSSYQSRYGYSSPKHQHQYNQASDYYNNSSHVQPTSTLNTSDIIGSLQSQIISLQSQPLQQAMLSSINMFNGTKKAEFAMWAQSIENATRICNLDAINITLSKLQGAPLKSVVYLEGKETISGKKLSWTTLKQHLATNYSEIPYDTHAINAYDTLQQGMDESTEAYLHRAQDILEHIHHTNNMSSITAIGPNHTEILTGLKDKKLHNKLVESKAKKWTNMAQVLHNVAEMAVNFERSRGYSLPSFDINHTTTYSSHNPNSNQHYRSSKLPTKETQQPHPKPKKFKCWQCKGDHLKKDFSTVTNQSRSKHSRPQDNKENQCKLFK